MFQWLHLFNQCLTKQSSYSHFLCSVCLKAKKFIQKSNQKKSIFPKILREPVDKLVFNTFSYTLDWGCKKKWKIVLFCIIQKVRAFLSIITLLLSSPFQWKFLILCCICAIWVTPYPNIGNLWCLCRTALCNALPFTVNVYQLKGTAFLLWIPNHEGSSAWKSTEVCKCTECCWILY